MKVIRSNVTNSTKKITTVALLKFGQEEHLNDLLKNGILYLSSIEDLRKEDNEQNDVHRTDSVEGAHKYKAIGPGTASTTLPNGKHVSFAFINLMYYEKQEVAYGNICSFYGITNESFTNNQFEPVDEKMTLFGTHFIFIKKFDELINRIDKALEKLKISWYYGYVDYFNENQYNGDMHMFKKRSRYEFQKEFRIYLRTQNTTPMKLEIGSIEDIAAIAPSDTISNLKITIAALKLNK